MERPALSPGDVAARGRTPRSRWTPDAAGAAEPGHAAVEALARREVASATAARADGAHVAGPHFDEDSSGHAACCRRARGLTSDRRKTEAGRRRSGRTRRHGAERPERKPPERPLAYGAARQLPASRAERPTGVRCSAPAAADA